MNTVLRRRLGHAGPWPAEAYRHVARRAAEARVEPAVWLRTVETRPTDLAELVAAATVPHTSFYRHPEQIRYFRGLLPGLAEKSSKVRIWSAGCATGEEPWTLAKVAEELDVPVDILATDVSTTALAKAQGGHYEARETRSLPGYSGLRSFTATPELRSRVRFRLGSLLGPVAPQDRGPFDVIFCRNVLIYFDPASIEAAFRLFEDRLAPWGAVVVAPVEALLRVSPRLNHVGPLGWFQRVPTQRIERSQVSLPPDRITGSVVTRPPSPEEAVTASFERIGRLLRADDTQTAERLLHALLSTRDDALGWFLLGETCTRRGEITQARIAYERAVRATVVPPDVDLTTVQGAAQRRARQL